MSGIIAVLTYLVGIVFSILIYGFWMRILLQYYKISSLNPLSQLIYKITNPFVQPFQKIFSAKSPIKPFDWITLIVILVTETVKIFLLSLFIYKGLIPLFYYIINIAADFIIQPLNLLFYLLLIEVIFSWISSRQHPAIDAIRVINAPLIKAGRKIIPDISGFDFAPFVMMLILQMITIFIEYSVPGKLLF